MSNPVTHWQILTPAPQRLEAFYRTLFGWTTGDDNPMGYTTVGAADEGIGGGFWPIRGGEGHSLVQLFIRVDDVELHVSRATQLGGRVVIPPQTLPQGDRMAVVADPDGLPFAVFSGTGTTPR